MRTDQQGASGHQQGAQVTGASSGQAGSRHGMHGTGTQGTGSYQQQGTGGCQGTQGTGSCTLNSSY